MRLESAVPTIAVSEGAAQRLAERALLLGADRAKAIPVDTIVVSWEARIQCARTLSGNRYRCPKLNKGYMCPTTETMSRKFAPLGGEAARRSDLPFSPIMVSVAQFENALRGYRNAVLVQLDLALPDEIRELRPGEAFSDLYRSNVGFRRFVTEELWRRETLMHEIVLALEEHARELAVPRPRGLASGPCRLCERRLGMACVNRSGKPCPYPQSARASMEAMGVDVVQTCRNADLPIRFPIEDTITWCSLLLCD